MKIVKKTQQLKQQQMKNVINRYLLSFLIFFYTFNLLAQDSVIDKIEIFYNKDKGYYNRTLNEKIYGLYDGGLVLDICLIFENSMIGSKLDLDNRQFFNKKDYYGVIKTKKKNNKYNIQNVAKMFFL